MATELLIFIRKSVRVIQQTPGKCTKILNGIDRFSSALFGCGVDDDGSPRDGESPGFQRSLSRHRQGGEVRPRCKRTRREAGGVREAPSKYPRLGERQTPRSIRLAWTVALPFVNKVGETEYGVRRVC